MLFLYYFSSMAICLYLLVGGFIYVMFCIDTNKSLNYGAEMNLHLILSLFGRRWIFSEFFKVFVSMLFLWPFCQTLVFQTEPDPDGGEHIDLQNIPKTPNREIVQQPTEGKHRKMREAA